MREETPVSFGALLLSLAWGYATKISASFEKITIAITVRTAI
ncbi:hypothetical protein RBE51_17975 [Pseudomonas taiwanensis]|nr:hypothetical protein [Pseudomonas taiwanensis]MDT8924700.1 hypothetical protein [Pseudomonas taiwanensis]